MPAWGRIFAVIRAGVWACARGYKKRSPRVVPTRSGRGEAVFIRAKVAKGRTYFAAVHSYRDGGGRVRHRTAPLGREPDVGKALARAEARVRALRAELRRLAVVYPEGAEPPAWAVRDRARLGRSLKVHEGRLARLREAKAGGWHDGGGLGR